ncbi:hypothetical protein F2Q69_00016791 [Brassica cretica]|uniref:Uncharacterized protein n=1 Tax=Brassica cretica TaxID=69181 RepID=A0A8S9R2L1_BRACR|nr:hypothetical protein F2Q69_00016791 [Brassica cretica]
MFTREEELNRLQRKSWFSLPSLLSSFSPPVESWLFRRWRVLSVAVGAVCLFLLGSRSGRVLSTVVVRALQFRSVVPPSAVCTSGQGIEILLFLNIYQSLRFEEDCLPPFEILFFLGFPLVFVFLVALFGRSNIKRLRHGGFQLMVRLSGSDEVSALIEVVICVALQEFWLIIDY